MPLHLDDPSVLTKERLKKELRAHNVELPGGNPTKDVYVQLYVKTVSARGSAPEALDTFSSDEELPPPVVSRRSGKKKTVDVEPREATLMSDEDLREQLLKHGVDAGPIVASTRTLYEKKLCKLLDSEAIFSQIQIKCGEADFYSDQEDAEVPATPELPAEGDLECDDSSCPPSVHSSSRHSIAKVKMVEDVVEDVEEMEKVPAAEPAPSEELQSFTLTATSRQPIKGAASQQMLHDIQHGVCSSGSSITTASVPPAASTRSSPSTSSEPKAPGAVWWKKLLLLILLLVLVVLVLGAMEPNGAAPSEAAEDL